MASRKEPRHSSRPGDWDAEARRAAELVCNDHYEAHRGAMTWRTACVCAIFGNDSYREEPGNHAAAEVALLRAALADEGVPVLGFGLSPCEDPDDPDHPRSWALLVRVAPEAEDEGDEVEALVDMAWRAWVGSVPDVAAWREAGAVGPPPPPPRR